LSYKEFDQSTDVSTQLSVVNEIIPLTGTLFSGSEFYTKTYQNVVSGSALSGGFWQTVFDGAPASISSSALVDLTYGHSTASLLAGYSETFMNPEKERMYKQMAQILLGNKDSIFTFNSVPYNELFFFVFKRRIFKDEIKKGALSMDIQLTGSGAGTALSFTDAGGASAFTIGSAGDEAAVFSGSTEIGRAYYNAGIVAVATGAFIPVAAETQPHWSGSAELTDTAISGNIDNIVTGLRNHLNNVQFQNQTNLHSTIYFCRALNADFNYSTNSSFVDSDGRIVTTSGTDNQTRAYATSVGMYDINNNLLAVAKTSEPIKKSPDNEIIFRIKLSY